MTIEKKKKKQAKKQAAKVFQLAALNLRKRNPLITFRVKGENQVKISMCAGNTASVFMSKQFLHTRDHKNSQWKLRSPITFPAEIYYSFNLVYAILTLSVG